MSNIPYGTAKEYAPGDPLPFVPRADFDEALALLKDSAMGTRCPICRCGSSEPLHYPDCRLAAFLKKWGK